MKGSDDAIAVTGIACRFPGASNVDAFWDLLVNARDAIADIPAGRWDVEAIFDPEPGRPGRSYARRAGLIKGVDRFDAAFFGIAPREASAMDPQHRLLLEVTWEALEDAGFTRQQLAGSMTGVYIGISTLDYMRLQPFGTAHVDAYVSTGNALSIAANRLSYCFGLTGPSLAVDTACSSSLVALHLAATALHRGEIDQAIVGGVNLLLAPELMVAFSAARMLAPDGRCKAFDARADGYVRGEGCGVVILKHQADADLAGDRIRALVLGSATNQDGRSNGLTAPSGLAQEKVVESALAAAGAGSDRLVHVEAHGTGTRLGDPIEALALARILTRGGHGPNPCLIGSVKTNIGHLEAAAGIAGAIKTILMLERGVIPPSLHYQTPNPEIPFHALPIEVVTEPRAWPARADAIAGVSSFGFGGSNAHAVLAPAPPTQSPPPPAGLMPIMVSHREPEGLAQQAAALAAAFASDRQGVQFVDLAVTATTRRTAHEVRAVVLAEDGAEAVNALQALAQGEASPAILTGTRPRRPLPRPLAVLGPSSGLDGAAVADLMTNSGFRASLAEMALALTPALDGRDLSVLAADGRSWADPATRGPLEASLLIATAQTLESWGLAAERWAGVGAGATAARVLAGLDPVVALAGARLDAGWVLAGPSGARTLQKEEIGALIAEARGGTLPIGASAKLDTVLAGSGGGSTPLAGPQTVAGRECLLRAAAAAFVRGHEVDWTAALRARPPVALPSYRWQRRLHWFDRAAAPSVREAAIAWLAGLPKAPVQDSPVAVAVDGETPPWIREHRMGARAVVPMAVGIALALAAGLRASGPLALAGFRIERPLPVEARLRLEARVDGDVVRIAPPGMSAWIEARLVRSEDWPMVERLSASLGREIEVPEGDGPAARLCAAMVGAAAELNLDEIPVAIGRVTAGPTPNIVASAVVSPSPPTLVLRDADGTPVLRLDELTFAATSRISAPPLRLRWQTIGHLVPPDRPQRLRRVLANVPPLEAIDPTVIDGLTTLAAAGAATALSVVPEAVIASRRRLRARLSALAAATPNGDGSEQIAADLVERYPGHADFINLVAVCARSLPGVLAGRINPLSVLFPPEDPERLTRVYRDEPSSRRAGALAAAAFDALIEEWDGDDRPLTVLEVGAGTGATTAALLPRLTPERPARYWFTDVTAAFLTRAATVFRANSRMATALFDVEQDPVEQGFAETSVDILVAANVLHATADLPSVLTQLRTLLAPGGVLLLQECTRPAPWLDVVFGLTDGWWRAADAWRGEDGPLLSLETWHRLLNQAGFHVEASAGTDDDPAGPAQAVLVARPASNPWAATVVAAPVSGTPEERLAAVVPALQENHGERPLVVVTRSAVAIGSEQPDPAAAAVLGLVRAVSAERPDLDLHVVDAPPTLAANEAAVLALATPSEPQLAIRDGRIVVPRLEAAALPAVRLNADPERRYLVTGGTGGLGLAMTERLIERGARHLVLAARRPPNEVVRARIAGFERRGATIDTVAVDFGDRVSSEALLNRLAKGDRGLVGVIHMAGRFTAARIADFDIGAVQGELGPKIVGTEVLIDAVRQHHLEFLVVISTAAATLGLPGAGGYGAANAAAEAAVQAAAAEELPVAAVAAGPVAGLGMALAADAARWEHFGIRLMQPAAILDRIEAAMASPGSETIALAVDADWSPAAKIISFSRKPRLLASLLPAPAAPRAAVSSTAAPTSPSTAAPPLMSALEAAHAEERFALMQTAVVEATAAVLGLEAADRIDPTASLMDLGMDSLTALDLKSRLEHITGLKLPATLAIEHPTAESIAGALEKILSTAETELPARALAPDPAVPIVRQDDTGLVALMGELAALDDAAAWRRWEGRR